MENYIFVVSVLLFVMYLVSVNLVYRFLWLAQFEDLLKEIPYPNIQHIKDRLDTVKETESKSPAYIVIAVFFPIWIIPVIMLKSVVAIFKSIASILDNVK